MRGLLVPTDEEAEVVSKRTWNETHLIAARLGCDAVVRVSLPPPLAAHAALFVQQDQADSLSRMNRAVTALLSDWSGGKVYVGNALFTGYDAGIYTDMSIVQLWRLGAQLVQSMRKQLA